MLSDGARTDDGVEDSIEVGDCGEVTRADWSDSVNTGRMENTDP